MVTHVNVDEPFKRWPISQEKLHVDPKWLPQLLMRKGPPGVTLSDVQLITGKHNVNVSKLATRVFGLMPRDGVNVFRNCYLSFLPYKLFDVFKSFEEEVTIWYLKRGLWSCKQPCFLIGPQLCIWSRVILDWTLLATGNLTSLLEKLLSCQRQLGRSSSLRLKISLVLQRLSVDLKDMLSQKMADQHLQQIISFRLQVKIWNYPTKRVSLSAKGYSTQTSKLIILSSLPQRLTKGFVTWRNARRNPRNVRVHCKLHWSWNWKRISCEISYLYIWYRYHSNCLTTDMFL